MNPGASYLELLLSAKGSPSKGLIPYSICSRDLKQDGALGTIPSLPTGWLSRRVSAFACWEYFGWAE